MHVHESDDPLASLIQEARGDIVVLAGKNAAKLATIARLHEAGFNVLADKPWLTSSAALPALRQATAGAPLAMDIMTGRYDVLARLRRRIVATPSVFGEFADDSHRPTVELASVHHLYKVVNGRPLVRPSWYYDVDVQGDGVVDIQSHLVDQVQWLVAGDEPCEFERDVELRAARRWTTPVPVALYRDSTGESAFPESLSPWVRDDVLELACNSEIEYRLKGVSVRQRAEWRQREPAGGGDLHPAVVRGTRGSVVERHGPETDYVAELNLQPAPGTDPEPALAEAVSHWREEFPDLEFEPAEVGYRFILPERLRTGHESHFAMVLDAFLDYLQAGRWPEWLAPGIRLRYTLLAHARELALR